MDAKHPPAQHGIAVDRFAREIAAILEANSSALAATECQPVGRHFDGTWSRLRDAADSGAVERHRVLA